MTALPNIPRIGPAADDGSGLGDAFVITYRLDDDERDRMRRPIPPSQETPMARAVVIVNKQRISAQNLRRDRERCVAIDHLHGRAPFWVACPGCGGRAQTCDCCHGVGWVSPILANQWDRMGL